MHYRVPEEEREKGIKNVFEEIMPENFSNLERETYPPIGCTEGPKQDEPTKTPTPRRIIIKISRVKYKERILKAER